MPRRNLKADPGTVARGRELYAAQRQRTPAIADEFEGDAIADDPIAKGEARFAARHGNRSARRALIEAGSEPDNVTGFSGDAA